MLSTRARAILEKLNSAGFEAYAVGGCVRDLLRGVTPPDVDITTSARPEETLRVFADHHVIPTGLQHGTVTVVLDGEPFEITTYRTDGEYSDSRHPDSVTFTTSLEDDLARRDFTVNAMAYHPTRGIIDPFGGQQDLNAHILRCVGNAMTRFTEDALRIARLVRFMSVLDFEVDADTAAAAHALCHRLSAVAAERKRVELMKTLTGDGFLRAAIDFADVLCEIVPSLSPLRGFDQQNPHHDFDIYTHTIKAVGASDNDPIVKLTVLLHDIGKPSTFSVDEAGVGHFYGHPAVSEALAKQTLTALRFDTATIDAVLPLVKHHDIPLDADRKLLKRRLSKLGEAGLRRLLKIKTADALGCKCDSQAPDFSEIEAIIDDIIKSGECIDRKMLAVNGRDLLELGCPAGPTVGDVLEVLLNEVLEGTLENTKETLTERAEELLHLV